MCKSSFITAEAAALGVKTKAKHENVFVDAFPYVSVSLRQGERDRDETIMILYRRCFPAPTFTAGRASITGTAVGTSPLSRAPREWKIVFAPFVSNECRQLVPEEKREAFDARPIRPSSERSGTFSHQRGAEPSESVS